MQCRLINWERTGGVSPQRRKSDLPLLGRSGIACRTVARTRSLYFPDPRQSVLDVDYVLLDAVATARQTVETMIQLRMRLLKLSHGCVLILQRRQFDRNLALIGGSDIQ